MVECLFKSHLHGILLWRWANIYVAPAAYTSYANETQYIES